MEKIDVWGINQNLYIRPFILILENIYNKINYMFTGCESPLKVNMFK